MVETRITKEEWDKVKADLLNFIHLVAYGELDKPEHIQALIPAVEIINRFFG